MRSHISRSTLVFALALAFGVAGCASSGGGPNRPAGSSSTRIVRAELATLPDMDAFLAIERLRPRWLQSRAGDVVQLYIDGSRRSNVRDLQSMRISEVEQMEYMSASDATTRYGTGHAGGAVLVTSRR
ncbi:MAG: hypothetical protein L7S64_10000 [Longimicrobiales bacterium]|nr:hypothetical protein [Longimicrobiales bacterium]